MERIQFAKEAMQQERTRLDDVLRAQVAETPPPASRVGLAWGDYIRQIIALCVSALDAFFSFILALWAPLPPAFAFRGKRPSRWSALVREQLAMFHEFIQREVESSCNVVSGNKKNLVAAALGLLGEECAPVQAAIDLHLSSNEYRAAKGPLSRWHEIFPPTHQKS
jgi:hypothetical protein